MGFLLLGLIAVCALALLFGAVCLGFLRIVLNIAENTGAESLPGAAAAGGSGWASCPNSPLHNLSPDARSAAGDYCDNWRNTIDNLRNTPGHSPDTA